jgi:integrase
MSRGERGGLLGHVAKPKDWSRLRLREPRRLPRGLTREESALLGSFRTWRDRAIAGLMLLSGLRSAEVFGLLVADVDIARRWLGASPDHGLKPWRIETFKLNTDPRFEDKLVEVVGVYLDRDLCPRQRTSPEAGRTPR